MKKTIITELQTKSVNRYFPGPVSQNLLAMLLAQDSDLDTCNTTLAYSRVVSCVKWIKATTCRIALVNIVPIFIYI